MPFQMIFHTSKTTIRPPPRKPNPVPVSSGSYFTGSMIANATTPSCSACGK